MPLGVPRCLFIGVNFKIKITAACNTYHDAISHTCSCKLCIRSLATSSRQHDANARAKGRGRSFMKQQMCLTGG